MYQTMNGMGSMGRDPREMTMATGSDGRTGAWNRQTMEMSDTMNNRNDWQSASEIFSQMPGSMSRPTMNCMPNNTNDNMTNHMTNNMTNNMNGGMAADSMSGQAHTSTPAEGSLRRLDLRPDLPQDAIENPTSLLEARLGSLRALLAKLVGHYVIVTFLIGTQNSVAWEGFLHTVGNDFVVIFQPDNGRYVTGDMFSLKFVEFHEEKGVIPACIGARRRDAQNMW